MTTEHKLYNGEIVLKFDSVHHKYTLEGKSVDGVTTILKNVATSTIEDWSSNTDMAALRQLLNIGAAEERSITLYELDQAMDEAIKTHKNERDGKSDLGKEVHARIESFIKTGDAWKGMVGLIDPNVSHRVTLFIQWAKQNVSKFCDSERVVYSRKNKYCGTLDFTCFLKDHSGLFVGDIKNTKYIYPKHFLQTAAYQQALREETRLNIEGRVIVRIGDDELETNIRTGEFRQDLATFKAIHRVNKWLTKTQKGLIKKKSKTW